MPKKGQLVWDQLIPWLIGLGVLILAIALIIILSGKGSNALEYFKTLFRFGR